MRIAIRRGTMTELIDSTPRATTRVPTPTAISPVNRRRVAAMTAVIAGFAVLLLVVANVTGDGGVGAVISVLAGIVLVPLLASPWEWLVHRCVYHLPVVPPLRPIFKVHTAHHFTFFPTWRYTTSGPARRLAITAGPPDVHDSRWANARVRFAHYAWYLALGSLTILLPAWLLTLDRFFLVGAAVSLAVVSNLFITVHDTIHRPGSHRVIEAQPWFAFLDRHHYIHHVDLGANLNFLLPLADALYGTLRTELAAEEIARHGTLEQARAQPAGAGERARDAVAAERPHQGI